MYLLDSVHQALGWTGISSVDPTLTAEVVLRLAMVYESSAQLETMDGESAILAWTVLLLLHCHFLNSTMLVEMGINPLLDLCRAPN